MFKDIVTFILFITQTLLNALYLCYCLKDLLTALFFLYAVNFPLDISQQVQTILIYS